MQSTKSAKNRKIDCDFGFKKPKQSAVTVNYLNQPHLKKLFIENKKRRERIEERKQEALVIMKEEERQKRKAREEQDKQISEFKQVRKLQAQQRLKHKEELFNKKTEEWKMQSKIQSQIMNSKPMFVKMEERYRSNKDEK